jgi:ribonuclease P protein component
MWKSQTLDLRAGGLVGLSALLEGVNLNDANVQAAQQAPHIEARVPQADGRPLGSGRIVAPSEEGSQEADRRDRLEERHPLSCDERLGRSSRLVRGVDIRQVLQTGRRSRRSHLDICWAPGRVDHARLGLVVARAGQTAVARNRLRRRLKEIWRRELRSRIGNLDVVVRSNRSGYRASFAELRDQLLKWSTDVAK